MRATTILFLLAWTLSGAAPQDSCVTCHSAIDDAAKGPAALIKNDVHISHGMSCADCHGGDPLSEDPEGSMSKAKGFKGKPARADIPKFCASCHSNPDIMRKAAPSERVDQFELYQTSVHGKRLAAGDANAATCIDCHSVHDIRAVKDPEAPVYPLHISETCSRCHSDQQKMAPYKIPTNQFAEYQTSVHWEAMTKRGDLSAPTCTSCHGNHGAKPRQLESVSAACGSCHVTFAELYEKSVHQPIFSGIGSSGGCMVCHSNHGIKTPSTAMLKGSSSVCATCHEEGTPQSKTAADMAGWLDGLDGSIKESESILSRAEKSGMEVSEAQVKLIGARENLVKARLALHSMDTAQVRQPSDAGMAIARDTLEAGEAALRERNYRRYGLGVSVVLIAFAILAIRTLLQRIEAKGS